MNRFLLTTVFLTSVLIQLGDVHAGGWTHPPGKGYFKLGEQIIQAESLFLSTGEQVSIPTYSRFTTSLYGEFGLANRLTLVGYIPFYQRVTVDKPDAEPESGISDWDVGVRVGLLTDRATVVSLQLMAGLPLGDAKSGLEKGLFTGDGEFNQHVSLQVGHSLYPAPGYLKGEIGYNNREGDYANELRYGLEAGMTIAERVSISVWLRGVEALGKSDEELTHRNDIDYLSFGPEINFHITPGAGISAGVSKFTGGHNLLDAPAWEIGVFWIP